MSCHDTLGPFVLSPEQRQHIIVRLQRHLETLNDIELGNALFRDGADLQLNADECTALAEYCEHVARRSEAFIEYRGPDRTAAKNIKTYSEKAKEYRDEAARIESEHEVSDV